jgi:hypothetical protein
MKKIIAAALLSLTALTFIAGATTLTASSAFARGGAGHDRGDDRGGRGR